MMLTAYWSSHAQSAPGLAKKTLVIGVLVPLTGGPAEQGLWGLQGAELGSDSVKNDEIDIMLKAEDTQADPKIAITAFNKLLAEGPLDAVITYGSGVAMALSPLCNQQKVLQIGVATATPAYRSAEDYTFRIFPSAELEAEFMAKEALKLFPNPRVTVVRINNEYGLGTAKAFKAELEKIGVTITGEEILEPSAMEYRSLIPRIKSKKPDLIYLASYPNEGALFLKQSKELGMTIPVLASNAILGTKNFFELAGKGAEGMLIASTFPLSSAGDHPEISRFMTAYEKKSGDKPVVEHIYASRAYDAVRVLAEAMKNCPEHETECLKEKLFQVKDFSGASGKITFDRNGDISCRFSTLKIHGERFELSS